MQRGQFEVQVGRRPRRNRANNRVGFLNCAQNCPAQASSPAQNTSRWNSCGRCLSAGGGSVTVVWRYQTNAAEEMKLLLTAALL